MKFHHLRNHKFCNWLIIHLRFLLGLAFFPSGMTKLLGHRFTNISTDTPIGYFFEGLYQSGFYWNFLGLAQLTAGILLMTQRFALLGTLMFFAMVSNIWIITISLAFKGTWIITSLMMIAVFILLLWDHHKLLPIISNRKLAEESYPEPEKIWIIVGIIYSVCFIVLSLFNPVSKETPRILTFLVIFFILLAFIGSNYVHFKKRKINVTIK